MVGAGPAGATAARVAAQHGARVLLIDGARFPRYKTCGGGLIGTSLDHLPPAALDAVEQRVATASFSLRGGPARRVRSTRPFLAMVRREVLDQALVDVAIEAGGDVPRPHPDHAPRGDRRRVRLTAADGPIDAGAVIGADGSAGIAGRHVGVRIARADLGLEVELAGVGADWVSRVHLDWGTDPGTYGWVFPKGDRLTVGVIQRKGEGSATREYLARFLERARARGPGAAARLRPSDPLARAGFPGAPGQGARRRRRGGPAGAVDAGRDLVRPPLRLAAGGRPLRARPLAAYEPRRARARPGAARRRATAPGVRAGAGPDPPRF